MIKKSIFPKKDFQILPINQFSVNTLWNPIKKHIIYILNYINYIFYEKNHHNHSIGLGYYFLRHARKFLQNNWFTRCLGSYWNHLFRRWKTKRYCSF